MRIHSCLETFSGEARGERASEGGGGKRKSRLADFHAAAGKTRWTELEVEKGMR